MYSLLFNVLLHNQRFFFKPSVVRSLESSGSQEAEGHREDFLMIMQAFGQSFLLPDIAVFRHNLQALETLNDKWKLYKKVQECNYLYCTIMNVNCKFPSSSRCSRSA